MNTTKRVELTKVINHCFENGPNKANTMYNLEKFIDKFYELKNILLKQAKVNYINELANDIKKHGGLANWKKDLKKSGKCI